MLCSYLCSALYRSRFSWVAQLVSHVFHYWGDGLFVPAATWCFAFSFVGFALTAIGSFLLADNVTGWSVSSEVYTVWNTCFLAVSTARTQLYSIPPPGTIGEMGLHPTILVQWRGQR